MGDPCGHDLVAEHKTAVRLANRWAEMYATAESRFFKQDSKRFCAVVAACTGVARVKYSPAYAHSLGCAPCEAVHDQGDRRRWLRVAYLRRSFRERLARWRRRAVCPSCATEPEAPELPWGRGPPMPAWLGALRDDNLPEGGLRPVDG